MNTINSEAQAWLKLEHTWALDQAEPGSPFSAVMAQVQGKVAQQAVQYIACPLCRRWFHPSEPHECHKDGAYIKF